MPVLVPFLEAVDRSFRGWFLGIYREAGLSLKESGCVLLLEALFPRPDLAGPRQGRVGDIAKELDVGH